MLEGLAKGSVAGPDHVRTIWALHSPRGNQQWAAAWHPPER